VVGVFPETEERGAARRFFRWRGSRSRCGPGLPVGRPAAAREAASGGPHRLGLSSKHGPLGHRMVNGRRRRRQGSEPVSLALNGARTGGSRGTWNGTTAGAEIFKFKKRKGRVEVFGSSLARSCSPAIPGSSLYRR
jgi:hypothetical protein